MRERDRHQLRRAKGIAMRTMMPKFVLRLGRLAAALTFLGLILFALASGVSGLDRALESEQQRLAPQPDAMMRHQSILAHHSYQLDYARLFDGAI